jgi:hypothetical protein
LQLHVSVQLPPELVTASVKESAATAVIALLAVEPPLTVFVTA